MVPLKYLSNFSKALEILWINFEISLMLTWSKNCFLIASTEENENPTFIITDTKRYVPVVTLSAQDYVKLLKQLESGFKRTNSWNKYQSKVTQQTWNRNLDIWLDPCFQRVSRFFVLSFKDRRIR